MIGCRRRPARAIFSGVNRFRATLAIGWIALAAGCTYAPFSAQDLGLPNVAPFIPDDELFIDSQWYLETIAAPSAWALVADPTVGSRMESVRVAVVDSGVAAGHPDLEAIVSPDGRDFTNGGARAIPTGLAIDDVSARHGTHVTGLIAAIGNNGTGISGVAFNGFARGGVEALPVVMLRNDSGTVSDLVAGILYAAGLDSGRGIPATRPARVINLSLGASSLPAADDLLLQAAVRSAASTGALLVAAAGNGSGSPRLGRLGGIDLPAVYPEVMAIGSVDRDLVRSVFSDYGNELDLVAPGAEDSGGSTIGLVSTWTSAGYSEEAGTSMATPLVSGVAALMWAVNPSLTAGDVRGILRDTADDLGPAGWDVEYGAGLLDADAALRAALTSPYGGFSRSRATSAVTVDRPGVDSEWLARIAAADSSTTWRDTLPPRVALIATTASAILIESIATVGEVLMVAPLGPGWVISIAVEPQFRNGATLDTLSRLDGVVSVWQERLFRG